MVCLKQSSDSGCQNLTKVQILTNQPPCLISPNSSCYSFIESNSNMNNCNICCNLNAKPFRDLKRIQIGFTHGNGIRVSANWMQFPTVKMNSFVAHLAPEQNRGCGRGQEYGWVQKVKRVIDMGVKTDTVLWWNKVISVHIQVCNFNYYTTEHL